MNISSIRSWKPQKSTEFCLDAFAVHVVLALLLLIARGETSNYELQTVLDKAAYRGSLFALLFLLVAMWLEFIHSRSKGVPKDDSVEEQGIIIGGNRRSIFWLPGFVGIVLITLVPLLIPFKLLIGLGWDSMIPAMFLFLPYSVSS